MKKYIDGMVEPSDFVSYTNYFMQVKNKTNTVDTTKIVFADLSDE
jgi:hypothetical protein